MRKFFLLYIFLMANVAFADFSFDTDLGIRTDCFEWGNSSSRSRWEKLRMFNVGFDAKLEKAWYGRLNSSFGIVYDGLYSPRGGPESQIQYLSGFGLAPPAIKRANGLLIDFTGGVGRAFCRNDLHIAPMIGFYYNHIHLKTDDYKNIVNISGELAGVPFPRTFSAAGFSHACLNSQWIGPWIGFDAWYDWDDSLSFVAGFEYFFVRQSGHQLISTSLSVKGDVLDNMGVDSCFSLQTPRDLQGVFVGGGIDYQVGEWVMAGFHVDYYHFGKGVKWDSLRFNLVLGVVI